MSDLYYFAMAANILAALEEKGSPRIVMARALRLACTATQKLARELESDGEMDWAIQHLTSPDMKEVAPEAAIPKSPEGVTVTQLD